VKLCDACGRQRDTARIRISVEGERGVMADLCPQCRVPLDRLRSNINARRPPRTGVADLPVASMEQVTAARLGDARKRKRGEQPPSGAR